MLRLQGVTAGYGLHTVVRDVDLTVPGHSVVALLGPNGAGKTTLLRVASGLLSPLSGSVSMDGTDITQWTPEHRARRGLCHVPEARGIFPALTVRDNLRLQGGGRRRASADGEADVPFPRLTERLDQIAGTLSGGEQQMLALTHAYVARPSLVLLDEVSMGLAPRIVDEIFDYLRTLAASGTALLLVEQYVTRALELADYVYVLAKGRVVFAGEAGEVDTEAITTSYLGALA